MYNQFSAQVTSLSNQLEDLYSQIRQVEADISWYRQFSLTQALQNVEELTRGIAQLTCEVDSHTKRQDFLMSALPSLKSEGNFGWNPAKWFSSEKLRRRREHAECVSEINSLRRDIETAKKSAAQQSLLVEESRQLLAKHGTFDELCAIRLTALLQANAAQLKSELLQAKALHARVDAALVRPLDELNSLEDQARQLASRIASASELDRDLSTASTSYDRAMTHQECEQAFGDGSPKRVLSRLARELDGVERNIEKMRRRIKQIGEEAGRDIQKLVFDGSNMCIQNGVFIGLNALQAAAMAASKRAKTIVVFDATMRSRLKVSDLEVPTMFGPNITIHVTPGEADETILDLAEDPTTFIVSNDRYAEFKDKAPVRDRRIIPHQLVDGKLFIRGGLDISIVIE